MEPREERLIRILEQLARLPDQAFRPPDGREAVLYSGRLEDPRLSDIEKPSDGSLENWPKINWFQAQECCREGQGRYSIDQSDAGRWLGELGVYDGLDKNDDRDAPLFKLADAIWSNASERFIANAEGHVNTFAVAAAHDRTFRATEIDALIKNEKILSVNNIARSELAAELDSLKRYEMIVEGEFRRDAIGDARSVAGLEARQPWQDRFMEGERVRHAQALEAAGQVKTGEIESREDPSEPGRDPLAQTPRETPDQPHLTVASQEELDRERMAERRDDEPRNTDRSGRPPEEPSLRERIEQMAEGISKRADDTIRDEERRLAQELDSGRGR